MNLTHFLDNNFSSSINKFFGGLNIPLDNSINEKIPVETFLSDHLKEKNENYQLIKEIYFAGQVNDKSFKGEIQELENISELNDRYDTMIIFGVVLELSENKSPSKTALSDITRLFNKSFPNRPVVVVFKYGKCLAFANCERVDYKINKSGEKLGKVSVLKDIDIDHPHSGHLRILEELKIERKGKESVNSFEELYKYWQKVFDVSLINKKFYKDLFNWYCWALDHVKFPNAPIQSEDQSDSDFQEKLASHNAVNVIRLITRIMFVWFLKEKKVNGKPLIPEEIFNEEYLKTLLDYKDKTGSTYYKAVLQNLFFATLNTEMAKDKSESRKFINRQSGVQGFYRYSRFFKDADKAVELFKNIPFLNGGLFENLDKNVGEANEERIDCFSDRPVNEDKLKVPDKLFFGTEEEIDLSKISDNKKQNHEKVRGLIHLLNSYKFTIDENTPLEEEVALDPELLGKVFENLLASYNPETKSTARKQTGSFYTPREIVDYIVDESLIAYLKEKLTPSPSLSKREGNEDEIESELRNLFSYSQVKTNFSEEDSVNLLKALDECKILDPACGSGAFPMGVLQKMVYVINKLDPDNKKFKEIQIEKIKNKLTDKDLEESIISINEAFDNNNINYARKLYLIENCIFGIDIQPIAVQISKLRFFISLIVDQKVDYDKPNIGVRPLPNLETKFVAANTLIGIDKGDKVGQVAISFENPDLTDKKNQLKVVRGKHFSARTTKTKQKYRDKDQELRGEIAGLLQKENASLKDDETVKLANWNPYDQNASSAFFDMEWMFGIKDGFDVVIGNPPYVQIQSFSGKKEQKDWQSQNFETFAKTGDIYCLFYEKGSMILREKGLLCFITSNKWMRSGYGENTRKFFLNSSNIKILIDFGDARIFENATTYTNILLLSKELNKKEVKAFNLTHKFNFNISFKENLTKNSNYIPYFEEDFFLILDKRESSIKTKSDQKGIILKDWDISINYGIKTGFNEAFIIDGKKKNQLIQADPKNAEIIKPILRGRDIKKYKADFSDLWMIIIKYGFNQEINQYSHIFEHLRQYEQQLRARGQCNSTGSGKKIGNFGETGQHHWLELDNNPNDEYLKKFEQEKIVWAEIVYDSAFYFDNEGYFPEATSFFMIGKNLKYIISLLNSKLVTFIFKNFYAGGDLRGNTFRYKKAFLSNLPIPKISLEDQKPFISLVDQIMEKKKLGENTQDLEDQIDQMVYQLYELTPEEIAIVEVKENSSPAPSL